MQVFEKIVEKLKEKKKGYMSAYVEGISDAIEIVKQVAAEYNNGWIPCSERLPKKDGFFIATLDGEIAGEEKPFSGLAEFENGKWVDDEEEYQCVLAWQPLPEPYHLQACANADCPYNSDSGCPAVECGCGGYEEGE